MSSSSSSDPRPVFKPKHRVKTQQEIEDEIDAERLKQFAIEIDKNDNQKWYGSMAVAETIVTSVILSSYEKYDPITHTYKSLKKNLEVGEFTDKEVKRAKGLAECLQSIKQHKQI